MSHQTFTPEDYRRMADRARTMYLMTIHAQSLAAMLDAAAEMAHELVEARVVVMEVRRELRLREDGFMGCLDISKRTTKRQRRRNGAI